jgi:hypothetical protein
MLWPASYHFSEWSGGVRIGADVRIGAFGGRLAVFNGDAPYGGSIIMVSSPATTLRSDMPTTCSLDLVGIYVRYIRWPEQSTPGVVFASPLIWVVKMQIWMLVIASASLAAFALRPSLVRRARRRTGRCENCGYDLRASLGLCPECGAPSRGDARYDQPA